MQHWLGYSRLYPNTLLNRYKCLYPSAALDRYRHLYPSTLLTRYGCLYPSAALTQCSSLYTKWVIDQQELSCLILSRRLSRQGRLGQSNPPPHPPSRPPPPPLPCPLLNQRRVYQRARKLSSAVGPKETSISSRKERGKLTYHRHGLWSLSL